MTDLTFARAQMGCSLAFHIIFAVIGIALPLMMTISEALWLKTKDQTYLELTKRWAKGTAILFAVGAVSGTVLSFELGLLWPGFMEWSGSVIGLPFALEGFAFFTEAIFLGIYLYGWKLVNKWVHLISGIIVSISGALSAIFVVIANAWMNAPTGFKLVNGIPTEIDPIVAMQNPAALNQVIHMLIASYASVGFLVAGVHAFYLLKDKGNQFHRKALGIALAIGCSMALIEPISGDFLAKMVAHTQPVKLAALEGQFNTMRGAPLRIGGIPNTETRETPYSIEVPKLLSFLAYHDINAEVKGLNDFPKENWPPVRRVHLFFQLMVACGMIMALVSAWALFVYLKTKSLPVSDLFLKAVVLSSPLGIIALEAGWMVTEFGRQPWVITGILKTKDAVTPMPGLWVPFTTFMLVYLFLGFFVIWLLIRQFKSSPTSELRPASENPSKATGDTFSQRSSKDSDDV